MHKFDKIGTSAKYFLSSASLPARFPLPCFPYGVPQPSVRVSLCPRFPLAPHFPQPTCPALSPLPPQPSPIYGSCFPLWFGVSSAAPGQAKARGQSRGPGGRRALREGLWPGPASPSSRAAQLWSTSPPQRQRDPRSPQPPRETKMNLDALFQQIQFTAKQAREKRSLIQQGLGHPGPPSCGCGSSTDRP